MNLKKTFLGAAALKSSLLFTDGIFGAVLGVIIGFSTGKAYDAGEGAGRGALIGAISFAIAFAIFYANNSRSFIGGAFAAAICGDRHYIRSFGGFMNSTKQKQLPLLVLFLFLAGGLFARGNNDGAGSGQDTGISSRAAIGRVDASPPLFEGGGGKDIRLAVLEPKALGLTQEEAYLPVYVQGLLNNNLGKYSAMTLTERQFLNEILEEKNMAANGNFSDTDYISIGNLTNAQYILLGVIQKIPGNQFSVQLAITDSQTGVRKAAFMKNSLAVQLQDGTFINQATEDLLAQMGVQITDAGKQQLAANRATMVNAETGLAKGISAQAGGASVEALLNYTQSVTFDPSQMEALSRLNILSTTIGGGTIGQQILNDIEARKSWLAAFKETAIFFNGRPPFEITFDPGLIQDGDTDYQ
jgi:hypothetical protein